ncbi:gamma-interferon-inducible lysosomal thiol reductase-like [Pollicipes pollicipes]|uniref:gamma-interferon-inducible lysosomal thiol reductase-like n=1 Tax=Pollicipes pollicipes TaxID=41117 RepID=UPI0018856C56|nr:gamma-interferon-inducible lysosomal thiol reductase-like [Pollicipes pollicipes]
MVVLPLLLSTLLVAAPGAADRPPLDVVLYFEALCPDCQDFISGGFADAWRAVPEILNVTLVPWGFATATPDGDGWRFTCQHGREECRGNKLHACGVRQAPSSGASVDFSVCLEAERPEEECADDNGLDWDALERCVDDPDTDAIMLRYRDLTDDARPEIVEVPTVSVDGSRRHQDDMLDDFLEFVCNAWQGETPPGCLQRVDLD